MHVEGLVTGEVEGCLDSNAFLPIQSRPGTHSEMWRVNACHLSEDLADGWQGRSKRAVRR